MSSSSFSSIAARALLKDGVAVLPVLTDAQLKDFNAAFHAELKTLPELKEPVTASTMPVLGGFGALGTPSSFHNPTTRRLRLHLFSQAVGVFGAVEHESKTRRNLALTPDRMSIRYEGTKLSPDSWHRDNAPGLGPQDAVLGGWVNLDPKGSPSQKLSCVKGSHVLTAREKKLLLSGGFTKETDADKCRDYEARKSLVDVPAGHWVFFYSHLMHEVNPSEAEFDSIRIYMGFQLTVGAKPLFDYDEIIEKQGIFPLPSGQIPPMFANSHQNFNLFKRLKQVNATLPEWSVATFKRQCLEQRVGSWDETPEKPLDYTVVRKFMPSLAELKLPLYPAYTAEEKSILKPARSWTLSGTDLNLNLSLSPKIAPAKEGAPKNKKRAREGDSSSARDDPPKSARSDESKAS